MNRQKAQSHELTKMLKGSGYGPRNMRTVRSASNTKTDPNHRRESIYFASQEFFVTGVIELMPPSRPYDAT